MSAARETAGAGTPSGHPIEEGTLEWQLLRARTDLASMLQSAHPASAVLHPLYKSNSSSTSTLPSRSSFQQQLGQLKDSVRRFIDEATTATILPQEEEADLIKFGTAPIPPEVKGKKQRVTTLLRENSSHSAAITKAAYQLLQTAEGVSESSSSLAALLGDTDLSPSDSTIDTVSLEEARKGIQHFIKACEHMARDLKMEAFADEHSSGIIEGNTNYSHTLTLAASILVVDVETVVEQQADQRWKPIIRLRLSYATDSATAKPVMRDQGLSEYLRADLQVIVDSLLGWYEEEISEELTEDRISRAMSHYERVKRTLAMLKKLDDLSVGWDHSSKDSPYPDLFAALDEVGRMLQSSRAKVPLSLQQMDKDLGIILENAGTPYSSLVYFSDPCLQLRTVEDVVELMHKQTLSLQTEKLRLHSLSISIAADCARVFQTPSSSTALPVLGKRKADDSVLMFTAVLHPAVVMPKHTARNLAMVLGVDGEKMGKIPKRTKPNHQPSILSAELAEAPNYEDILSDSCSPSSQVDGVNLQFANKLGFDEDPDRQGILVSQFSFASLDQLKKAVVLLRQQSKLNNLLCDVCLGKTPTDGENEITLESILSGTKEVDERCTAQLSLTSEESGAPSVLINVPLSVGIWTLEVKVIAEDGNWTLRVVVSEMGQEKEEHLLERESSVYQESVTLLTQKGGRGLKEVVTNLRTWALRLVGSANYEDSREGPPALSKSKKMAVDDQVGPLPNVSKVSPSREPRPRGRRTSSGEGIADETTRPGVMTRRRSSAQSTTEEKDTLRNMSIKRRASQAGMDEEEGLRRASRKKS